MEALLWVYRNLYWIKQQLCPRIVSERKGVHPTDIPWLWVGTVNSHGQTIAWTSIVNEALEYGDHVTTEYLTERTGDPGYGRWRYIDMQTLEEKDFPSEGMTIYGRDHIPHSE